MSQLKKIIGNEEILLHFKNAIQSNMISHAYIINGATGMGKTVLVNYIATLLQCEEGGGMPCGKCHSCNQAATDNQPDIIWVTHEKPTSIGVQEVRDQVIEDAVIKPYSSRYKIYIIDEAEYLTIEAQNALLKTLEEPPEYAIIFLVTSNASAFLSTILSRCVTIKMKPKSQEVIRDYLEKDLNIPERDADIAVAFAYGNIGKAIRLATMEGFKELKKEMVHLVTHINKMDITDVIEAVKRSKEFKLDILDYFDLMIAWYRDLLLFKASQDMEGLLFKLEINDIKKQAVVITYAGIGEIIASLEKAKARLKSNVNFELVIELLYLSIKENMK